MTFALAVLVGVAVGAISGWALQRLTATPLIRTVAAAEVGWMCGGITSGLVWLGRTSGGEGIAAISLGMNFILVLILVVPIAGGLHAALGLLRTGRWQMIQANRALVVGTLAGLCSAVLAIPLGDP